MRIIEKSTIQKNKDRENEDGLVITGDFVAVIDGSTSKSSHKLSRWCSNGRLCMKVVRDFIRKMPSETSAESFCIGVSRAVFKRYNSKLTRFYIDNPEERIAASCIVYSRLRRQIWMVGDCQCLIGKADNGPFVLYENPKPYETELANLRAEKARELLESGLETEDSLRIYDKARDAIIPRMKEWMRLQNIEYAVIDGFRIPMTKVKILTIDFEPWTIILASDGYPFLKPSLTESEEALAAQKHADPLNIGPAFRATKAFMQGNDSFDDRTYVKFSV